MSLDSEKIAAMARDYTNAWCSGVAENVSSFYAPEGGITINEGEPCDGRDAVTEMARGFMESFPDLSLHMDSIRCAGNYAVFMWTLEGTNTGPGGTGNKVVISGWEYWKLSADYKVQQSLGHYNSEDYDRQIAGS